ncbi:hypothetical protein FQZ97_571110 [compost metagenome]
MPIGSPPGRAQEGSAFLWALVLLLVLTLAMGELLELQSTRTQRFLEEELLWAGEQHRNAIKRYYEASPGTVRQLPRSVEDLLEDPRLLALTRHLRAPYPDPVTRDPFEAIHDVAGNLVGVRSTSGQTPLKSGNFPARYRHFEQATTYRDWEFIFLP